MLQKLADSDKTEYVMEMKTGQGVEVDGKLVSPTTYFPPKKDEGTSVELIKTTKGEIPQKLDEVLLSDQHCKALGIKAEPGTKVTFTFLDNTEETYTISGIYHIEGTPPYYSVIYSEEYGQNGSQLKDAPCSGIVRIHGAEKMSQDEFLDTIRTLAADCGIERKNVNENNFFLRTLSGGDMQQQETILIAGVSLGILLVSVLVIYSVFYLSVVGRIQQFGQLRTIGMTRKQIKKMVRREGMFLCAIGIPLGLFIGGVVSYLIRPAGWSWRNAIFMGALIAVADIITVLCSIRRPAKIAAAIAPVEASKFSGYQEKASKKLFRKITPAALAHMSSARNRKRTTLTMISLGVGGTLFMLASFFATSVSQEEYARQGTFGHGEFSISLSYNAAETAENGTADIQKNNPINEDFIQQIQSIDGVKRVNAYQSLEIRWQAHGENESESAAPFDRKEVKSIKPMLEEGTIDYDEMQNNNEILINYNNVHKEEFGWGFKPGDTVKLSWYDGDGEQEDTFTVAGILDTDSYVKYSNNYGMFILPEETLNEMVHNMNLNDELSVKVDMEKYDQVSAGLEKLVEENPTLSLSTLKEMEETTEESFRSLNAAMVGLSIFIVAFSIINLTNTLITNIVTRKREFAMLQSVGMTKRQLVQMIEAEGLFLAAGNLVITLIGGTAAGYGMVRILQYFGADYMHFHFPGWFFAGYAVFLILVTLLVSSVLLGRFQKQPLVERLREALY